MDIQVKYIESNSNPSALRKGGIHLKGLAREERQPVHLLFLIDTSGSMDEENRLNNVKRSMNFILPFMTENDQISLVTFSDDAKTHITRSPITDENKRALEYKVSKIRTEGNTNLSAGLLMASTIFEQPVTDSIQRKQGLVILTDGHANAGVRSEDTLLEIVKAQLAKFPGLSMTVVAYGENHNTSLMSKIGIEGGGSYNIVKNLEDVASVFGEILGGLMSCSAQMIEVYLPPGAECDTIYSKETLEGGITKIRIGDIYAEAEQTIIFKSSPEQGPIRISGIAMPSLATINEIREVELLAEGMEPDGVLKMADYRQQVSLILNELRTNFGISTELKDRALALKTLLENSSFREDPLVLLMIEDLKAITDTDQAFSRFPNMIDPTTMTSITQHATYFGVARGLRTPSHSNTGLRQAPSMRRQNARRARSASFDEEEEMAPGPVPALAATESVFSNPVQRHITQTLRSMTQQPNDENDENA